MQISKYKSTLCSIGLLIFLSSLVYLKLIFEDVSSIITLMMPSYFSSSLLAMFHKFQVDFRQNVGGSLVK